MHVEHVWFIRDVGELRRGENNSWSETISIVAEEKFLLFVATSFDNFETNGEFYRVWIYSGSICSFCKLLRANVSDGTSLWNPESGFLKFLFWRKNFYLDSHTNFDLEEKNFLKAQSVTKIFPKEAFTVFF